MNLFRARDQLLLFIWQFKDTYQLVEFLPDSETGTKAIKNLIQILSSNALRCWEFLQWFEKHSFTTAVYEISLIYKHREN